MCVLILLKLYKNGFFLTIPYFFKGLCWKILQDFENVSKKIKDLYNMNYCNNFFCYICTQ